MKSKRPTKKEVSIFIFFAPHLYSVTNYFLGLLFSCLHKPASTSLVVSRVIS